MDEDQDKASEASMAKLNPWATTSWEGNAEAHLDQVLASSYEARFLWVCETYEFLKDTLPSRKTDDTKY